MKRNHIVLVSLCLFFLLIIALANFVSSEDHIDLSESERQYLAQHKTIRFISQKKYPPFEFLDQRGNVDGMSIELARWLSSEIGFKAEFESADFSDAQKAVLAGEADILTSLFASEKRRVSFDFTEVYFDVPASIFIRTDRLAIRSLEDLAGKTIAIQKGDYAFDFLTDKGVSFRPFYTRDFATATAAVVSGQADAIIGDEQIVLYYLYSHDLTGALRSVGTPLYVGKNCMAVKRGNPVLVSIMNKGLDYARRNGMLDRLNKKWLGIRLPQQGISWAELRLYAVLVFLLIGTFCAWVIRLRRAVAQKDVMLSDTEARYRDMFENSITGMYQSTPDGRFIRVNRAFAQMVGYADPAAVVSSIEDIAEDYYSDSRDREEYEHILTEYGHIENFETQVRTRDGSLIWISDSARTICDERNRIRYYEGVCADISKRKEMEEMLEKSSARIRFILDSIPVSVYLADLETRDLLFMNAHAIKEFSGNHVGRKCYEVFMQADSRCSHCPIIGLDPREECGEVIALQQGENPVTGRYYVDYGRIVPWDGGRLASLQIKTDITEVKRMEEQLRRKYKMEAVGLLAGGVAHNFNNSLGVILGNIELALLKLDQNDASAELLKNARSAILNTRSLIKKILNYSRQQTQEQGLVQLGLVVDETMKLLRSAVPLEIDFSLHIEDDLPLIMADDSQLQEIIINLCNNAVHAMDKQGLLSVSLTLVHLSEEQLHEHADAAAGDYLCLQVCDTGEGIDARIMERIFDPFFTTKGLDEGSGMGLASVQGIVVSHKGFIQVTSVQGEGAGFSVYFPVPVTDHGQVEVAERRNAEVAETEGGGRILLVDDDRDLAHLTGLMLEECNYHVVVETDSRAALRLFQSDPSAFDLLITDLSMPELSGLDLVREVRMCQPELPVILCSGYDDRRLQQDSAAEGINAFCMKPLEMEELFQTVSLVLHGAL